MIGRRLIWVGDVRRRLLEFPEEVRTQIGHALWQAQCGFKDHAAKPMKGLGNGVFEIVADHDGNAFRAVYAIKIGQELYVLHAFQKKSVSGIATPQREIDLIRTRLKLALQIAKERS